MVAGTLSFTFDILNVANTGTGRPAQSTSAPWRRIHHARTPVRACTKDCITVHRFVTGGEFFEEHVTFLIAQERYKVVLDYLIGPLSGIHSTRFPSPAPHKRPGAKTTGKEGTSSRNAPHR